MMDLNLAAYKYCYQVVTLCSPIYVATKKACTYAPLAVLRSKCIVSYRLRVIYARLRAFYTARSWSSSPDQAGPSLTVRMNHPLGLISVCLLMLQGALWAAIGLSPCNANSVKLIFFNIGRSLPVPH